MSADNWRVCPRCVSDDAREILAEKKAARAAYGKVPEKVYLAMKHKANGRSVIDAQNLREDYEIKVDEDGVFSINYHCHCEVCGFDFRYTFEEGGHK